jgi:hypothetical protein
MAYFNLATFGIDFVLWNSERKFSVDILLKFVKLPSGVIQCCGKNVYIRFLWFYLLLILEQ